MIAELGFAVELRCEWTLATVGGSDTWRETMCEVKP